VRKLLDIKLLSQPFRSNVDVEFELANAKLIAEMYSKLENCISVLSDLKARKSYISYGSTADLIGLVGREEEIKSIWEDELLGKIHQEDLQKKYKLEIEFFQLLNTIAITERGDYELITKLRIKDKNGKYLLVKHRLLYIASSADASIWLALCLYNVLYDHPEHQIPQGVIINNKTANVISNTEIGFSVLLSPREKDVLQLIKYGNRSKEIADKLNLSINTINRHRQNIFQKLNVSNAMEACRMAENAGLI